MINYYRLRPGTISGKVVERVIIPLLPDVPGKIRRLGRKIVQESLDDSNHFYVGSLPWPYIDRSDSNHFNYTRKNVRVRRNSTALHATGDFTLQFRWDLLYCTVPVYCFLYSRYKIVRFCWARSKMIGLTYSVLSSTVRVRGRMEELVLLFKSILLAERLTCSTLA
jgi:hypothetical protein